MPIAPDVYKKIVTAKLYIDGNFPKVSHVTFFVLDQDKAYEFYVNKLGFKVNTDAKMENSFRWLTELQPQHC